MFYCQYIRATGSGNSFIILWGEAIPEKEVVSYFWKGVNQDSEKPDGLILLSEPEKSGDIRMRVFNPDGSATAMCLNGIRCAARVAREKMNLPRKMKIETDSGIICVEECENNSFAVKCIDSIHFTNFMMSDKSSKCIESISEERIFTYITVYTPYILTVVDKIYEKELEEYGLKANELVDEFPIGINVSFIKKLSDRDLYVRTFERGGIGLSLSCSSSMVAASYMMVAAGECPWNTEINVFNKGGMINVTINNDNKKVTANLKGDAIFEHEGRLSIGQDNTVIFQIKQIFDEKKDNDKIIKQLKIKCKEEQYLISL